MDTEDRCETCNTLITPDDALADICDGCWEQEEDARLERDASPGGRP